jgi:5-carboxyvanillate decarboxylase
LEEIKMNKLGRRSFLKTAGQAAAIMSAGLSVGSAFAETPDPKQTKIAKGRPKRIAVEEHITWKDYPDEPKKRESDPVYTAGDKVPMSIMSIVGDISSIDLRLKDMEAAGIDMQVLSWSGGGEGLVSQEGITKARKHNDKFAEIIRKYPGRFAGYCMLPWQETDAAVSELERAVKELGLQGPKVSTFLENGDRLDNKKYRPIFKKLNELDVPMFLHPRDAHPDGRKLYEPYSELASKIYGYSADVHLAAMRMILSGLFDEYPRLKIILGHMGEGVPFHIGRVSGSGMSGGAALAMMPGNAAPGATGSSPGPAIADNSSSPVLKKTAGDYIKENFYAATSGNFYDPALICCYMAMPDHVLFGVDWPPEANNVAVKFMEAAPLSDSDKEKIYHLNAERIFKL